jgi:hypothetical protein
LNLSPSESEVSETSICLARHARGRFGECRAIREKCQEKNMSELSYNWSFEVLPIQNRKCPCCDDRFQLASGIIRDDQDAELALYVANLTPATQPREAKLSLMFKDKTRRKHRDRLASLRLRLENGDVATSVVTDKDNPLGHAMTREQVLGSPLKPLIFEIANFAIENDPHIRPFLEGEPAPTTDGSTD